MNKTTVRNVAYELQGTCQSLHEVLERFDMDDADMESAFCAELDSLVFECTCCNWWYETSEMSEYTDWQCKECAEDDQYD